MVAIKERVAILPPPPVFSPTTETEPYEDEEIYPNVPGLENAIPVLKLLVNEYLAYLRQFKTPSGTWRKAERAATEQEGQHKVSLTLSRMGLSHHFFFVTRPAHPEYLDRELSQKRERLGLKPAPVDPNLLERQELFTVHTTPSTTNSVVGCWIQGTDYAWVHRVKQGCGYALPAHVVSFSRRFDGKPCQPSSKLV